MGHVGSFSFKAWRAVIFAQGLNFFNIWPMCFATSLRVISRMMVMRPAYAIGEIPYP
jgi:hypothetical protein